MKIYTERRPWGKFLRFTSNEKSTVKIIEVNPGEILSLQSHRFRSEFWYVLQGSPTFVIGKRSKKYKAGQSAVIKKGVKHRISNTGKGVVRILEISTGRFDEKDIVRYEDIYGRIRKV